MTILGRRNLVVSACGLLLGTVSGCKSGSVPSLCEDTTGLTEEERGGRTALAYVDRSGDPNKACQGCQQWVAATRDGACGSCKLLKGPIHPLGGCKAFAAKG
jgi:hypothetical protein